MRISDWSSDVCSSDLFLKLLFEAGDGAVGQLAGPGEVAGALRLVERRARGVELFLDLRLGVNLVLFRLPFLGQFGRLLFEIGKLGLRSEEHTSELQSLMRISYAVFCLKNKTNEQDKIDQNTYEIIKTI